MGVDCGERRREVEMDAETRQGGVEGDCEGRLPCIYALSVGTKNVWKETHILPALDEPPDEADK